MKRTRHALLGFFHRATAACFLGFALNATSTVAQETTSISARTTPVGISTLRVPARHARPLSLPLKNTPVFAGAIANINSNTISVRSAHLVPGSWGPFEANPFVLRILSGPSAGSVVPIANNTVKEILLTQEIGELLSPGDRFEIVPVDTLADLFGSDGGPLATSSDPALADHVMVCQDGQWITFFNDGTQWLERNGNGESRDTFGILPEHGVFLVRNDRRPLLLRVAGEVSVVQPTTEIPASAITFLAQPFAVHTRLANLQLETDEAWQSSTHFACADLVHLYVGRQWRAFYHDGRFWRNERGGRANPPLLKGSALIVQRRAGEPVLHAPEPPYELK